MTGRLLTSRGSTVCRSCGHEDLQSVLDLGEQPLANRLLRRPDEEDPTYPLHLKVCPVCALGQVGEFVTPQDIFGDYPYLSSTSTYWLDHVRSYARHLTSELALDPASDLIIEVASNDGHLLKNFRDAGHRVLGIEPAANVAALADRDGIPTDCSFFGRETAKRLQSEHGYPRLIAANNVLAHVPDLDDFLGGLANLCGPATVVTIENPSMLTLLAEAQFDTIYHEHFSYLTTHSVAAAAAERGLQLVRVEELRTHGGSNRYWLRPSGAVEPDKSVATMLDRERAGGLFDPALWNTFATTSHQAISGLRDWLSVRQQSGAVVAAYGAAAKGNTFLNAVGTAASTIAFVVDGSHEKQGRFLPGSRVPVLGPEALETEPVDEVLLLPWNIADELALLVHQRAPSARAWIALPHMEQLP